MQIICATINCGSQGMDTRKDPMVETKTKTFGKYVHLNDLSVFIERIRINIHCTLCPSQIFYSTLIPAIILGNKC